MKKSDFELYNRRLIDILCLAVKIVFMQQTLSYNVFETIRESGQKFYFLDNQYTQKTSVYMCSQPEKITQAQQIMILKLKIELYQKLGLKIIISTD